MNSTLSSSNCRKLTISVVGKVKGEGRVAKEVFSEGLVSLGMERGRGRLAEGTDSLEGTSIIFEGPKSMDWNTETSAL